MPMMVPLNDWPEIVRLIITNKNAVEICAKRINLLSSMEVVVVTRMSLETAPGRSRHHLSRVNT